MCSPASRDSLQAETLLPVTAVERKQPTQQDPGIKTVFLSLLFV
jgi:hypothetical protein